MVKITKTNFDGLIIFEPKIYEDLRGSFCEVWRRNAYCESKLDGDFMQDNVSFSKKHVLRGLHYQKNQAQLVTVLDGKIFDVVVDIRQNSKTYKSYFSIELDAVTKKQIYMPAGFAHGFYVLSDSATILYKCTQYYNPSQEGGIIWNDSAVNIKWPPGEKIISDKDRGFQEISCLVN